MLDCRVVARVASVAGVAMLVAAALAPVASGDEKRYDGLTLNQWQQRLGSLNPQDPGSESVVQGLIEIINDEIVAFARAAPVRGDVGADRTPRDAGDSGTDRKNGATTRNGRRVLRLGSSRFGAVWPSRASGRSGAGRLAVRRVDPPQLSPVAVGVIGTNRYRSSRGAAGNHPIAAVSASELRR